MRPHESGQKRVVRELERRRLARPFLRRAQCTRTFLRTAECANVPLRLLA
jgi:hypothetical protein